MHRAPSSRNGLRSRRREPAIVGRLSENSFVGIDDQIVAHVILNSDGPFGFKIRGPCSIREHLDQQHRCALQMPSLLFTADDH